MYVGRYVVCGGGGGEKAVEWMWGLGIGDWGCRYEGEEGEEEGG